jgi:NAD(P)-dependent dehydrogenase (short-subunit alcohol dehydrogenase family)
MSQWTTNEIPDLTGKRALVTGANSGLGLETVRALAEKGAQVFLACRSREKGQRALAEIQAGVPASKVELVELDLASLASVRACAEDLLQRIPRLDLLFNNAGIMAIPRRETLDGFEMQFGVNHLGHFALTGLLLPLLLATPQSRIITTTSQARSMGGIVFDDLQRTRSYGRWNAYGQSKRANLLFAFELQARLVAAAASTISVAAHPGYAQTNLQTTSASESRARLESGVYAIFGPLMAQSARMGALPQLYAGTSPDIVGGELVGPGSLGGMRGYPKVDRRAQREYDRSVAARLWEESVRLTGVQYLDLQVPSPAIKE